MEKRGPAAFTAAVSGVSAVQSEDSENVLAALPKAELHVHLEGSIEPPTAVEMAARHGVKLTPEEVAARYEYADFAGFLDAFKWVTSLLRAPEDYALITQRLADQLLAQNVAYAEVTVSAGVMVRRGQDVERNFAAIRSAANGAQARGLRLQWILDAVRQFGPAAAMEVARCAAQLKSGAVVAFGLGGDELALPAADFRGVYDYVASEGLHRVVHAGEIGGPEAVQEAIELLGVERIGHGIAIMRDERIMDFVAARQIPLELCLTSNLRTGALARHLHRPDAKIADHPLPEFFQRGLCVTLSTDDPAMFHTDLAREYRLALQLGLSPGELIRIARESFEAAFLPAKEKQSLLETLRAKTAPQRLV